ncbi:MAG: hypothetical protein LQ342_004801 [Letrouitia transgressa]|nr:MAG: hypothetical protein LQ342_004801 [Letrouitia transgressa]
MQISPASLQGHKGSDEVRLAELGYGQALRREWSLLHNFGASFSIISVITGITSLFSYGLNTGGPGVMSWGFIVVNFFTLFVGASMAEILSAIPTSGGPYFWAYMLAPQQHAPFYAWITGWFNLIGQIAVTAGVDFGLAKFISVTAHVCRGYNPSAGATIGIMAGVLFTHVLANMFSVRNLRYVIYGSIMLNTLGIACLCIAVLATASNRQTASFVFAKFFDGTGADDVGWSIRASPAYVAVCGILIAQYTSVGYDASAHLCEETRKAVRDAPIAMLCAIAGSAVMGFFVLVALLFSIQDFERMSNSRMMFAFARDGGIPHRLHIIDRHFKAPVRTVLFGAICSLLLALPSLGSAVAFYGTTSIATIGLYISYGIPISMTLVYPYNFKRGPFQLGGASKYIAVVSCLWIGFITVVFCLPTFNPVTSQTFNYTSVALSIVGIWAFGSWFFWANKWFTGRSDTPESNHEPAESPSGNLHRLQSAQIAGGKKIDSKITVSHDFEVYHPPSTRGFTEI